MPQSLPNYPNIALSAIKPASTLLFYGGNKITEFVGNKMYKHPYKPPAFHAAITLGDGLFLNVGKFKTIQEVASEFRSTRRVDVIEYDMTNDQRETITHAGMLDASKPRFGFQFPDYSWTDYLRFGIKFLRPSKRDFCSENVAELMQKGGVSVSQKKPVDTAPWTLLEYAIAFPDKAHVFTLYRGKDFSS